MGKTDKLTRNYSVTVSSQSYNGELSNTLTLHFVILSKSRENYCLKQSKTHFRFDFGRIVPITSCNKVEVDSFRSITMPKHWHTSCNISRLLLTICLYLLSRPLPFLFEIGARTVLRR